MAQIIEGCRTCGKEFANPKALIGHMGGAHGKLLGTPIGHIEHGTVRGYQKHLYHDIPPCRECRAARAKYVADHRARGRARKS